ncbi:MAG: hypothetical protein COT26_02650 [Candidatus Kerfeldbacteria bacterium CG08_land_8_20_14_0_20_43_14]|uniref:Uncharacterized protein n=1 Tax=Candidatus Kerfeldbacteria bacterium CG08_land_8_20_14_0_20_43_14 TaxID=2014246 RepID=A0A2H0YQ33_9BACT|nr:MAG: hypothetical protein COT26_02650 [Candidatus Kerfeldbacteria bacterium CG08_land_8_20_14_0_20_43_14]
MARIEASNQDQKPERKLNFHLPVPRFRLGRLIRLVILILIVWVIIQVSRTGLWQIPLFSKYFYHQPQPIRIASQVDNNISELAKRVQTGVGTQKISISEAELTSLLTNSIQSTRLGISRPNLVAEDDTMEFSFIIPKRNNALVRLYLIPKLSPDSKLEFEVKKTLVGEISVANWFIGEPTKLLLTQELTTALKFAPKIQQVWLEPGNLIISFKPA